MVGFSGNASTIFSSGFIHQRFEISVLIANVSRSGMNAANSAASRNDVWLATMSTRLPASRVVLEAGYADAVGEAQDVRSSHRPKDTIEAALRFRSGRRNDARSGRQLPLRRAEV